MKPLRKVIQAALVGVAASVALVFAGTAMSAVNPKLTVTSNNQIAGPNVTISAGDLNPADDAIGKLQIFVPAGFSFKAPTSTVGTAVVTAVQTDRDPGSTLLMTGGIGAISPTDPSLAQANASCDAGPHLAAWMVTVTGSDDAFSYPVFVDQTAGAETQYGGYKLVACFLSPAAGIPVRSDQGNKFVTMALKVRGFTLPTKPGNYIWRSLWTPFAVNTANLNTAGNVEAQSTQSIATNALAISGKVSRLNIHGQLRTRVALTGTLLVGGKPAANVIVAIHHGTAKTKLVSLGSAMTNAAGIFKKTVTLVGSAEYYQAGATVPSTTGGCQPSFGVPCLSSTAGSTSLTSNFIRFKL
jgi:hypothetical protein